VGFFTQGDRSGRVEPLLDAYAASYEHAVLPLGAGGRCEGGARP
jgi:hypothetical protein